MRASIPVRNPRTGAFDYAITPPDRSQLASGCQALRQAQSAWAHQDITDRVEVLQAFGQALRVHKDDLVEAIATDTGRWQESVLEVESVLSSLDRWCRLAPELLERAPAKPTSIPFIQMRSQLVPYALVGVISPWNFPLLLSMIDTIPALLAGCAVVVKPSELTPRFIQPLRKAIARVPALTGVLSFWEGGGDTGALLIDQVDLVCFTGSVSTGQSVAIAAAKRLIPAFLELGGKDPAIVLASADIDLATSALLWGAVVNAGQSCLSIERIYVAEKICDRLVDALVQKAQKLTLAYPTYESGQIGPIIAQRQATIIADQLEDALAKGANVHCGGTLEELGGGLWLRPTVLTQVNHTMKIMTEETFGPILPIMAFSTVTEAIDWANDSIYGLSASVYGDANSEAEGEAQAVAAQIQAGAISINDAGLTAFMHEGEKQAFKSSGLGGSRMGASAISRFFRKKALFINNTSRADPWWFKV